MNETTTTSIMTTTMMMKTCLTVISCRTSSLTRSMCRAAPKWCLLCVIKVRLLLLRWINFNYNVCCLCRIGLAWFVSQDICYKFKKSCFFFVLDYGEWAMNVVETAAKHRPSWLLVTNDMMLSPVKLCIQLFDLFWKNNLLFKNKILFFWFIIIAKAIAEKASKAPISHLILLDFPRNEFQAQQFVFWKK